MDKQGTKKRFSVGAGMVFALLIMLPLKMPLPKNTDPKSAFINAAFYYSMISVGVVGSVVSWGRYFLQISGRQKNHTFPEIVAPLPPGAVEQNVSGTVNPWVEAAVEAETTSVPAFDLAAPTQSYRAFPYASIRKQVIACEWYLVFHHRFGRYTLLALPAFFSLFFVYGLFNGDAAVSAVKIVSLFTAWFIFLFAVSAVSLLQRFPRPDTVRSATVVLTSDGIYDATPEKQHFAAWIGVTDIRMTEPGVFLFHVAGANYIPRKSFEGGETVVQEFYTAAQTLWKSGGVEWPGAVPPIVP